MKKVDMHDLVIAIAWLEANEGGEGESDSCQRVADMLRREFKRRDHAGDLRIAKKLRVPVEHVKKVVADHRAKEGIKTP